MKIIFIPGLICTSQVWGDLNQLRAQYDCIDADVTQHDTIEAMVTHIYQQLPNEEIVIIGISMGSYVALDLALRHPKNLKKLILISATANNTNLISNEDRLKAIEFIKKNNFKELIRASANFCFYKPNEQWIQWQEQMAEEIGKEAYIQQQMAIMSRKNRIDELLNISCETLIVAGKQDRINFYQDAIILSEKIPQSQLLAFNQCGHVPTWEKSPELLKEVSEFLLLG